MRLALPLLAVLVLAAACGSGEPVSGGAPTSTEGDEPTASVPVEPTVSLPVGTRPDPSGPPWVLLDSAGGEQRAVQGSYCVSGPIEGTCTEYEGPVAPEELSVVRPEEQVELVVLGAETAAGSVSVRPLGCPEEIASFALAGPTTRWTVDLAPGSYELHVAATFDTGVATGDTSVALGLLVDANAPLGSIPRPELANPCVE